MNNLEEGLSSDAKISRRNFLRYSGWYTGSLALANAIPPLLEKTSGEVFAEDRETQPSQKPTLKPSEIAFGRGIFRKDEELDTYLDKDIFKIGNDGKNLVNITNTPDSIEYSHAYSLDGKLAWVSNKGGIADILVLEPNRGLQPINVTKYFAQNFLKTNHLYLSPDSPSWSPDSKKIVFEANREKGGMYIFVADLSNFDGNEKSIAFKILAKGWQPIFSPTEDIIAYLSRNNIHLIRQDSSDAIKITPKGNYTLSNISWILT